MKKLILTIFVVIASVTITKSQNPYWRAGGNTNVGPDPVSLANNFLGTAAGNNIPVAFGTNGTQRIFINDNTGPFGGFVGIGNGFSSPRSLLHIHDGGLSYLQVTNIASGNGALNGVRFGLFGPTANAVIAQQNAANLYFSTAGPSANIGNVRMSIVGLAGPNQGFVGIGTSYTAPNNLLDINGGDIDVNTAQRSYMIADQQVLWHKGGNSNLFVGVGAPCRKRCIPI